jgi:DNA-binding protein HU-beta
MNKQELIKAIHDRQGNLGLTQTVVAEVVNRIINTITKELAKKEKVTLVGFGTFSTANRKAKTGVNPKTGKPLKIPAKTVPTFKAGQQLKDTVNS